MPELPEVEVTRRALAPEVEGRVVRALVVREGRLRWPVPLRLPARLAGQRVLRLDRRGKFLLWRFRHGTLISHLGMSGSWRLYRNELPSPGPHDHVDLVVEREDGVALIRLTDPRRFGALLWQEGDDAQLARHPLLVRLGIEPFDPQFDGMFLYRRTRGRRIAIKPILLSGQIVVGVGNIYASESLYEAAIDPRASAERLSRPRCARLVQSIQEILSRAIAAGGSSIRDFIGVDGRAGRFSVDAQVYERNGLECRRCKTGTIRRIVQSGRASYFCPHCQRR